MADEAVVEAPLTEAQKQLATLQAEQATIAEQIAALKKTADEEAEAELNAGRELVIEAFANDLLEALPEDWAEQLADVEATGIQITMGPDPENPEGDTIPLVRLTSAAAKRTTKASSNGNGGGSSNLRQGRKLDDIFQEVATSTEHAEHDAADNNSKKWQIKDRIAKAAGFASGS